VNKYKIIIAHPGRQHSYRLASALKKNGHLFKYITTVYNKDSSLLMKIGKLILNNENVRRLKNRINTDLNDYDVVQFNEIYGLLLLLLLRLDSKKYLFNLFNNYVSRLFGKKVANYAIKNNVDAVICYDGNFSALTCFNILEEKAPQILRVIDHAHPPRNFLYGVYKNLESSSKEFTLTYENCEYLTSETRIISDAAEIKSAQKHIVASDFSIKALYHNNVNSRDICKVPYGVNHNVFKKIKSKHDNNNKIKILFIGEINQRKGIKQILEAAKILSDQNFEFNLIGLGMSNHSELYKPYKEYVNFLGLVSFETLLCQLKSSDVFIFPSLGEGFGLVLLEALSSGLPVICSRNCAGPDLIQDGKNGFLIDAGDTNALVDKLLWFESNRDKLPEMSQYARKSSSKYTWENYEKNVVSAIEMSLNSTDK
jgi:glycosyltransferase involved in cell wall biosynthesis